MPCCCAVGCKNRAEDGFRMFRFLADSNRKKIWLAKLRRDAWMPTAHSRLCEVHFDSTQFESNRMDGRRLLKPFAVPEIFLHRAVKSPRKLPARREIAAVDAVKQTDCSTEKIKLNSPMECVADSEDVMEQCMEISRSDEDKDETIRKLRSQVSALYKKIQKLEASLEETTQALKTFLNQDQLDSLGKKCNKGQRWSNTTVRKALQIRFTCGVKGYNSLLNLGYPLPSDRTLSRRLEEFKFYPGILVEVFDFLRLKGQAMQEQERYCVLLLDEMAIEEKVELDRGSKTLFGYTTLPQTESIATHALVFMLAGVSTRWKQVVGYHFTGNSFPSLDVKNIILEIVKRCHDIGLTVICITCDMGSCNRAVWKQFGINCGKFSRTVNFIPHPCRPEINLFFMADVSHVLKNIRNHLLDDKCIYLPEHLVQENCLTSAKISLEPVKKLVSLQADRDLKIVPKLTKDHVFVKQYQKMRVHIARDVMSNDVAAGIRYCIKSQGWDSDYLATALFFEMVDKWFSLMCSRHPVMAISKLHIDVYEKSIEFLKKFVEIFEQLRIGDGKWKPVQTAVTLNTKTILDLQDFFLNECSFGYLLTSRFCQDSLENLFSTVRVKNPIPSPVQFKNAIKIISIAQFMVIPSRGNCDFDEGNLLAEFLDTAGLNVGDDPENLEESVITDFEIGNADEVHRSSLYYLCGYVVRQILQRLKCDACEHLLKGDGSEIGDADRELLDLKEQKSLTRSSKWCWELAQEAETVFQCHKTALAEVKIDLIELLCKKMCKPNQLIRCHNVEELFLKKFFLLRIEFYAKALSETNKQKTASISLGHGSRSVFMRKIVK